MTDKNSIFIKINLSEKEIMGKNEIRIAKMLQNLIKGLQTIFWPMASFSLPLSSNSPLLLLLTNHREFRAHSFSSITPTTTPFSDPYFRFLLTNPPCHFFTIFLGQNQVKKKMSSSFYSPPEKPPRLYLPLSLSEWDLRARRNSQKEGKLDGVNTVNNGRTSWRSSSVTSYGIRKNWSKLNTIDDDIRIGKNNGEMWNDECNGIVGSSSKEQQNDLMNESKTVVECKNPSNDNNGISQKRINGGDDISITSSTRSSRLKTRLLNHSQSLAKIFSMNAFRSRSKSARITKRNEVTKGNYQKMNNCNEMEIGNEIPPLGEHLAWLRSCGIFGNEENEKEDGEENEGIWLVARSKSVAEQNGRKIGQWNGGIEEEEKWTTIFVANELEENNMICTRL